MSKGTKTTQNTTAPKADVYERVTSRLIAYMEQGTRPWLKPWSVANTEGRIARPLRHNGTPYRGVNVVLLWCDAIDKGFQSSQWMTYRQAQELGGQVRKGEAGSLVVYADRITKTETNERGEDEERSIPFMKGYTVFNVDQIDGLPSSTAPRPALPCRPWNCTKQPRTFSPARAQPSAMVEAVPTTQPPLTTSSSPARDVQGCRELRRDQGPRADSLDRPQEPQCPRIWQALRGRCLRLRGTGRRAGSRFPVR